MADDFPQLTDWLNSVLIGLVSSPDAITIEQKTDEMGVLFTISTTNIKDAGVLIGRKGEHVNALRVLLRTHGHRHDVKASLKVLASPLPVVARD